jgi:hypothetical protein
MKVKQLIEELKKCNQNAEVTIVAGTEDDNVIDTNLFELHAKDVDEYIELFIPLVDMKLKKEMEEENLEVEEWD